MSTTLTDCASSRAEPAAARWMVRLLERLHCGSLTLRCPDGRVLEFAGAQTGPHATLTLADWQVCGDILSRGDIGLAETWIAGRAISDDLTQLLLLAALNEQAIEDAIHGRWWATLAYRLRHWLPMKSPSETQVTRAYELAKERYSAFGVDTDQALATLYKVAISLHCWQGDDVGGYENPGGELGGGLAATGNYPGKARTADELRQDLDLVYSLLPGNHRLNLHSIYAETGGRRVERTDLRPEHFTGWVDWAKANQHGLDFNPTCFSHPLAADGFTLSHRDPEIRRFWIEHCIACRKIGARGQPGPR